MAACSLAVGTRGADTVYKFTTFQEKECNQDQNGKLPFVTRPSKEALTVPDRGSLAADSLYLRHVLR